MFNRHCMLEWLLHLTTISLESSVTDNRAQYGFRVMPSRLNTRSTGALAASTLSAFTAGCSSLGRVWQCVCQ